MIFCRLAASKTENKNPRNPHKYLGFGDFVLEAPPRIELGNEGFADLLFSIFEVSIYAGCGDFFAALHLFYTY